MATLDSTSRRSTAPARQEFRSYQRGEFNAALAAAARDTRTTTVETASDGSTVVTVDQQQDDGQAARS